MQSVKESQLSDRRIVNEKSKDQKMRAHTMSLRCARNGQEYCGDACRDAGGEDVEIACQCDHLACPLTFRQFADLAS